MSQRIMPKVSIIILSYNARNDVVDCLESVFNLNYPNHEIIIVDNGSTDGSWGAIKAMKGRYPLLKLIRSKLNLGRTGGYNLGLKYATGEYIMFLDQDTIVDKNMVNELVKVIEMDPTIGAVGPKIYYYNDPKRIWSAGTSVNLLTGRVHFLGCNQIDKGQFNSVIEVQQHPTAILVKREAINKINGYDKDIFMVYCDADFCVRIWKACYKIVLAPKAKLWHKVKTPLQMHERLGMKTPLMAFLIGRNRIIFMKKHALHLTPFLLLFMPLYLLCYSLVCLIDKRLDLLQSFWKGTANGSRFIALNKKSLGDEFIKQQVMR